MGARVSLQRKALKVNSHYWRDLYASLSHLFLVFHNVEGYYNDNNYDNDDDDNDDNVCYDDGNNHNDKEIKEER